MPASPELVIFDCDGVLVDSEPIAVAIDALILKHYGLALSETEIVERFVGRSPPAMTEFIEARLGRALPAGWHEQFSPMFERAFEAELHPVDGIEDALARIEMRTCVASSSNPRELERKLRLTGLYERFAGRIFSAAEVANGKPAPDLVLHAARRMGVEPAGCVVVEDSRHGVAAARAAGMHVFAYAGGVTPGGALRGPRTTVFDEMRELPELLDRARDGLGSHDGGAPSLPVRSR
ncbi:MAG: HAD family hydrolase [Solirubrobacteraceae bacterium]